MSSQVRKKRVGPARKDQAALQLDPATKAELHRLKAETKVDLKALVAVALAELRGMPPAWWKWRAGLLSDAEYDAVVGPVVRKRIRALRESAMRDQSPMGRQTGRNLGDG